MSDRSYSSKEYLRAEADRRWLAKLEECQARVEARTAWWCLAQVGLIITLGVLAAQIYFSRAEIPFDPGADCDYGDDCDHDRLSIRVVLAALEPVRR